MSGQNPPPKAISSLAKPAPSQTTRQGAPKLKFVPTLPARRKPQPQDAQVKQEPSTSAIPADNAGERGRGRGRERGRGRGDGGPRPPIEMTASGPFAMGPAMTSVRRAAPTATIPSNKPIGSLGAGLVPVKQEPTPISLNAKGKGRARESLSETPAPSEASKKEEDDDHEVYSDPDEGVEIVDMDDVKTLDYMAPDSIRREREAKAKVKKEKVEEKETSVTPPIDASNALDLSESEDEEELEDIVEDFTFKADVADGTPAFQDRLYFFQLPHPFPVLVQPTPIDGMDVDEMSAPNSRHVSFAPDVKPAAVPASGVTVKKEPGVKKEPADCVLDGTERLDGVIGTLLVRQSGRIQMELGNGAIYDVTPSTQPSFHQAAVHVVYPEVPKPAAPGQATEGTPPIEPPKPTALTTLGTVTRHFSVTPSIDQLLGALERKDHEQQGALRIRGLPEGAEAGMIRME